MRKYLYILILLFVLLISSCQSATPEPTLVATEEPTREAVVEANEEPVATETATVDQCVQCHTDKEQLIATAKLEVVVESESSGVG